MKKIIFKLGSFPHASETFIVNSIIETIKADFKVEIILDQLLSLENSSQQSLLKKHKIIQKVKAYKNPRGKFKRLTTLFFTCLNPYFLYYFIKCGLIKKRWTIDYIYQIKFYSKYKKDDVFHVHFGNMAEPLIFLKKIGFLKSKIIVTFHGYDAHFSENTYEKRKDYYKDLFSHVDLVTVNTPYLKTLVLALGCPRNKIEVVPMPVDTDFFISNADENKIDKSISILSVGRLINWKGHRYGLRAIKILIDRGYNVHYRIIGEGEERANLEEEIKKNELVNHITLEGKKDQDFIKNQLQMTDVFLMTSVADYTGRKEAQGVVSIEAQSCGNPVVAFKSGGVPYTLLDRKTGFLCEESNLEEMVEKIVYLIEHKNERKKMGKAGRKFVLENYSNKVISKKWRYIYSNM